MSRSISLSSKGQVTLPSAARKSLRLEQGDVLTVTVDPAQRSITLFAAPEIEELSARISGYAAKREPVTDVDDYYQAHRGSHPAS